MIEKQRQSTLSVSAQGEGKKLQHNNPCVTLQDPPVLPKKG
jgi:hypothetical protein